MPAIVIRIEDCRECPFSSAKRHYTSDSFEYLRDFYCTCNSNMIAGAVEHEKVPVPDWCPNQVEFFRYKDWEKRDD